MTIPRERERRDAATRTMRPSEIQLRLQARNSPKKKAVMQRNLPAHRKGR
ncbi:hypothetical protein HMPREF0620_0354 [Parascardovia denticolens DSM 10105 = JCM 12538]|uniref:Uncharacterized protein n=1 Tax=Parascardovia denticolens DSM 10105 = JCM 12538 TaxID=864564 RepID=E6K0L1_PARDN|nr:hypothetical protein HMPREF0620_0354 [Parascardovia denticolens DSM 10105 = JCM 12538]